MSAIESCSNNSVEVRAMTGMMIGMGSGSGSGSGSAEVDDEAVVTKNAVVGGRSLSSSIAKADQTTPHLMSERNASGERLPLKAEGRTCSSSSSSSSSSSDDPFQKYIDDYLLDSDADTGDGNDDDSDEFERDQGLEVVMTTGEDGDSPEFHLPDPENACAPRLTKRVPSIQSAASGDARDAELKAGMRPDGKPRPVEDSPEGRGEGSAPKSSGGGGAPFSKERSGSSSSQRKRRHRRGSSSSPEEARKLSYFEMAKLGYKELVHAIIRPPRADYREEALGPPAFVFCGRRFTRTDFGLPTERGLTLRCSHWEPVDRTADRIPVVIYMHGNSSARVEVVPQLSYLLSLGVAVFSFDFAGSGKSDGDYVSLGYYEREDLTAVISHLRSTRVVSTIALWGRSMGAATALMHGDRDPSIACMILDSPFSDLTQLAEEMVEKGREQGIAVPNIVVSIAIRMIRGSVKKKADFDIKKLSPIRHADKCFIPALFVAGEHDDFIDKRHSEAIHARYAGDKNLIVVEGDHNSPRPRFMFDSASIFLRTCLQIPEHYGLRVPPGMNLLAPPWFYPGSVQGKAGSPEVSPSKPHGVLSPGRPAESGAARSSRSSSTGRSSRSGSSSGDGGGGGRTLAVARTCRCISETGIALQHRVTTSGGQNNSGAAAAICPGLRFGGDPRTAPPSLFPCLLLCSSCWASSSAEAPRLPLLHFFNCHLRTHRQGIPADCVPAEQQEHRKSSRSSSCGACLEPSASKGR